MFSNIFDIYGMSQNPNTKDFILIFNNITLTSENKHIDNFIQEIQLNTEYNIIFEWIPYYQFDEIKETGKNDSITIYSAIWKDGPLCYQYGKYERKSNKVVTLKCLHDSQDAIEFVINKVKYIWNTFLAFFNIILLFIQIFIYISD
jgi:hypothetical protein